jgi:hypothetical protein
MGEQGSKKKFKPVQNEALHKAMVEKRRSSAASPQDNRPNRERSRKDAMRAAISRSRNED